MDTLRKFLAPHGLDSDDVIEGFIKYLALLQRGRRAMNLIGPLDRGEIIKELFCDCLTLATLQHPLPSPILDIGSGAGLPGVPLKLVQPDATLWLVEPREKRYRFLGQVIRQLGLTDAERHRSRIEDIELPLAGTVCSKAVAPVKQWLPMAAARVRRPDGVVAVLCADEHWSTARENQAKDLGLTLTATQTYAWRKNAPLRRTALLHAY